MNWLFVGPIGGLVWFVICRFIYRPEGFRDWVNVWFKTGCAMFIMFGISELVQSAARYMMTLYQQQQGMWLMGLLLTVLVGAFFFTWKALVRDDKTVGRSVFEFGVSVSVVKAFDIFTDFDGASSLIVIGVFILAMMALSKVLDLAKQRWIAHRDAQVRQRIGLVINAAFIGPFLLTPLVWIVSVTHPGLEQALGLLTGWPIMEIYVDAAAFLLESV